MITLDDILLPNNLLWKNKNIYSPIIQNRKFSVTGAVIIQESKKITGRLFVLSSKEQEGWLTQETLDLLKAKEATLNLTMTLNIHGEEFNVMFYRPTTDVSPLKVEPVVEFSGADEPGDYYIFSTELIEV